MGDSEWRDACNAGTTAKPEAGFAVSSYFDRSAWCIGTNVGGIDCHWGTALLLYFWRLPATVDERHHARLALRRMSTWNCIIGVAVLTFFSVPYLDCLLENWEFLLSLVIRH